MKKLFYSAAVVLTATFFVSTTSSAQRIPEASFKSTGSDAFSGIPSAGVAEPVINNKALKSFNRNFKTSADVKWSVSGELIQAFFNEAGKQTRVFYRSNGKWFRTISSYDQSLLDNYIKSIVKRNYLNYDISCVIEVHEGNMNCYFVNIEKGKDFKQVIVYDGEVFLHQEFEKQ